MLRHAFAYAHYDLYQSFCAAVGAVLVIRILFNYSWQLSAAYGVTTIAAYWLGQGVVALLTRRPHPSSSTWE